MQVGVSSMFFRFFVCLFFPW
uniref:Uncharacterized protein n=1 Tax=Arundo donax TaxID=35708 RepID=A0A0A9B290_ARUDO